MRVAVVLPAYLFTDGKINSVPIHSKNAKWKWPSANHILCVSGGLSQIYWIGDN